MGTTQHKLDIFKVLGEINKKNREWYTSLSEDEQKSVHPLVLMKWMSGTSNERQILMLNEFANKYVFPLSNHKKLLTDTLVVCSPGKWTKYNWVKTKKKSSTNTPHLINIIKDTFDCSEREAIDYLPIIDDDSLIEMSSLLGKQPDELKIIKKEIKSRK